MSGNHKTLGELFTFKNGRSFRRTEWKTSGLPIIRIQNLNDPDASFNYFDGEYNGDILVERGDLLFSWSGTIGTSFGSHIWDREPGVLNQHIFKVGMGPEIDSRYAFHTLRYITTEIEQSVNGSVGLVHITKEKLNQFTIPLPPLIEQQRIVGILDEAFTGIATAKANAKKNLCNARELFAADLRVAFDGKWETKPLEEILSTQPRNGWSPPKAFQTGEGNPVLTLSAVTGFQYDGSRVKMSSAPTRKNAHYWLRPNELLITRSNTRELVGHVAIYDGSPPNAICCDLIMKMIVNSKQAFTRYVYYFLRAPYARNYFTTKAHGASSTMKKIGKEVVQKIIVPLPPLPTQKEIVRKLDAIQTESKRLESLYQQKLVAFDALKKSLLHRAFSGQLTAARPISISSTSVPLQRFSGLPPDQLHAAVVAISYRLHQQRGNTHEFGHVMAEKTVQMVEAHLLYDLARHPKKHAAGPLDFDKRRFVDRLAKQRKWFRFEQSNDGGRYEYEPLGSVAFIIEHTKMMLGPKFKELETLLNWMLPMKWQQAEIVATVYAGWNNLLLDGQQPTDEQIVYESRENWHEDKLKIERDRFFKAIDWLRKEGVVPSGKGKRVIAKGEAR